MLALGRYDPHPARRRFPDVALDVDLQAVGDSGSRVAADVDEHLAVGHRVVGQDAIAPHVLVAAAVRVENFFVERQRQAVRVGDVVDDAAHLAALDHVDTLEVQALARVLLAKAQAAVGVGEVDRAVALDDDVVRAVELPAFETVGEHGALAVLLDPVDRPSGPCRDDEPALPVEGEPVRADHVELLEQGIARVLSVGLLEAHAPDVGLGVAAAMHVDGRFAPGRELVDHVRGDVAQEQVATLLDPDDALGEPETTLHQLQTCVGGYQCVERRVEPHDGGLVRLHLSARSAGSESRGEQDCGGNRRVLHETPPSHPQNSSDFRNVLARLQAVRDDRFEPVFDGLAQAVQAFPHPVRAAYGRIENVLEGLHLVPQQLNVAGAALDFREIPLQGVDELRHFLEIDLLRLFVPRVVPRHWQHPQYTSNPPACYFTSSTGIGEMFTTRFAQEPSSRLAAALIPRVPMTMRTHRVSRACLMMVSATGPTRMCAEYLIPAASSSFLAFDTAAFPSRS